MLALSKIVVGCAAVSCIKQINAAVARIAVLMFFIS
jgi:hypothetical protein